MSEITSTVGMRRMTREGPIRCRVGTIVQEKDEVPGMGWYAVFADTEGNELALWESAPRG